MGLDRRAEPLLICSRRAIAGDPHARRLLSVCCEQLPLKGLNISSPLEADRPGIPNSFISFIWRDRKAANDAWKIPVPLACAAVTQRVCGATACPPSSLHGGHAACQSFEPLHSLLQKRPRMHTSGNLSCVGLISLGEADPAVATLHTLTTPCQSYRKTTTQSKSRTASGVAPGIQSLIGARGSRPPRMLSVERRKRCPTYCTTLEQRRMLNACATRRGTRRASAAC